MELDSMEVRIVQKIALERFTSNRKSGVHDAKMSERSNRKTDEDGFGAELAFCKLCNLYPDFSIGIRSGGFDCKLNGNRVDVKQTPYENGRLLGWIKKQRGESDIYVLMIGTLPTFRFVGWTTDSELINKKNITNLGHGETYAMAQYQLNLSLNELRNYENMSSL